jgi:hypothetical protein
MAFSFLTKTFQDITYPEDLEVDLSNARRLRQGELSSYQLEKRYIHQDGHLVTVLLAASLVRDARGEPRYFIAQSQDISERKRLEQHWRFLAETGPQLAGSLDPQATLGIVTRLVLPAMADWCVIDLLDDQGRVLAVKGAAVSAEKARASPVLNRAAPRGTRSPVEPDGSAPGNARSGHGERDLLAVGLGGGGIGVGWLCWASRVRHGGRVRGGGGGSTKPGAGALVRRQPSPRGQTRLVLQSHGFDDESASAVVIDSERNIVVLASFRHVADFGTWPLIAPSPEAFNLALVKYPWDGTPLSLHLVLAAPELSGARCRRSNTWMLRGQRTLRLIA